MDNVFFAQCIYWRKGGEMVGTLEGINYMHVLTRVEKGIFVGERRLLKCFVVYNHICINLTKQKCVLSYILIYTVAVGKFHFIKVIIKLHDQD